MEDFARDIQQMVNNFQIEIIRQFEIQKSSMENLVAEYLIDQDDNELNQQEQVIANRMQSDMLEGEDYIFYSKYGKASQAGEMDQQCEEEDEFDNGYYF